MENTEKELYEFIKQNKLNPFNEFRIQTKQKNRSIFKTPDARKIHRNMTNLISENFVFKDTSNLFNLFEFTQDPKEIKERQEFFNKVKQAGEKENNFLKNLEKPSPKWKPDYDVIVVTENSETFNELKKRGYPAQLIISESDLQALEDMDIVQVLDCEEYSMALEKLPQAVFIDSIEEAYMEKYLEQLSGWKENLEILKQNKIPGKIDKIVEELYPLLDLTKSSSEKETLTYSGVQEKIEEINEKINQRAKDLSVSGDSLVGMLSKGELPKEIKDIVYDEIRKAGIPEQAVNIEIPLKVDEEELDKIIKRQSSEKYSEKAEEIKSKGEILENVPENLENLSRLLLIYDFISGISKFIKNKEIFPKISEELKLENAHNLLLENPQPVSFYLNEQEKASILTGANSGGKTTLMEHIIQFISLKQLGLPVSSQGEVNIPLFSEVYYFAKNKGDISKGAFENLLDQMSKINVSEENQGKVLILADEIESVTEPGVAGKIISATADYFIKRNAYLVVATHLGDEVKNFLPEKTRIDGIEAQGLDKDFNLIVNHNPVKGKLANSTPELIVERLAKSREEDYFKHLDGFLKR